MASVSLVGAQTIQTLCSFNSTNGANPYAALTLGKDDSFYGTTRGGGSGGCGTVFKITINGLLTTLVSFNLSNGSTPTDSLTLGSDGNFYGTTSRGGGKGYVTVFKITTNGTLTTLVSFDYANGNPSASLTLGQDGNFYGASSDGIGWGTIFRVTTNGLLTTLVAFNLDNGGNPAASLTLGNDGFFYGTTSIGGGTVFRVSIYGSLRTLATFDYGNGNPTDSLTLGTDGNFYGTTGSSYETVFKVTTNGTLTTLVAFKHGDAANSLTLGNDGNFYGTTMRGGANSAGTVFVVTPNGTLISLASFGGSNGDNPAAALTLGNDGNFYGTTSSGGNKSYGTVFRLLLKPIITFQPRPETNNAGATVTFLVGAASPQPIGFQWQKNGVNLLDGDDLSGATTSALTISNISDIDAASYSVVVSNANGSITSSSAVLTVTDPPGITVQPSNQLVLPGTNVSFGVSLTGSALFFCYQWRFNSTDLVNATNGIYTIPSVGTNDAGDYSVVVTNAAGAATSSNGILTVVLSPESRTNYASTTATFSATALTSLSLNYQWQKNGASLIDGGRVSGATNSMLTIANVSDADAASYAAVVSDAYGSVTTSNALLTVIDLPFIASQPRSQIVLAASTVTFNAIAYGASPLVFQWYFNGTPIGLPTAETNSSSYTLSNVGTNQAGNYSVQVVNGFGSVTSSNAKLTVEALPPAITTQPASRTNKAGTTATFSIVAASLSPLTYKWQKNGTNLANGGKISGAKSSSLTMASVSENDAASYPVTVSNLAGSITSSNATLTVVNPPSITAQPLAQRVLLGRRVSFGVFVTGTAPLSYQWRFNGATIPSETNAGYTIEAVGVTNTGIFSVIVTNMAGSATSSGALLTVILPPTLALQFSGVYPLLRLDGMLSNNFVVQYSETLEGSNWMKLLSLTNLPTSPYLLLDPAGVGQPARFYRVFMQ